MMKKTCLHFFINYSSPLILYIFLSITIGCHNKPVSAFSKSAEDALSTFKLAPGFKMELVASEPLIKDPVGMTIDENGRMYVVEMCGVPFNKSGVGRVMLLSDTNGDGRMDKSTVFGDSLILPSGIMRWKKGVIVTDAPNVYYMEDSNGDGIADIKNLMLIGFDTANLEGNVNNPIYGLDNWIYLAGQADLKGSIHYVAGSNATPLQERTLRFRPDRHELEPLSGKTQFGHTFDSCGNHLLVENSNHIYQEVIAARYLQRNPAMLVSNVTQTLADPSEVFSITKNPEYQRLTDVGVFTSACGLTAYLSGAFPDKYNSNVTFVAEPVSNMVHVDHLTDTGVTFKADRILEHKEFLASTDVYSRMVNMYIGPDGALYVIDFYRQVIEGPEFMAKEVLDTINLYNGNDKGRIYRISATDAAPAEWTKGLHLGDATDDPLVEKLDDKNIWWRLNAQRLLVDRNSNNAVPLLIRITQNLKASMGRLHALWTLEGMNKLTPDLIIQALKDPLPGIRENAIKLAELHLTADHRLVSALLALWDDPNAKVRFIPGEDISKYLLQQWSTLTQELRDEAIHTFIGNPEGIKLLLDKIESGEINRGSISWRQSVTLRSEGEYMERARTLLTEGDVKRKDVIEQYQAALKLNANAAKGKSVFQMKCAICHQVGGKLGSSFGPDLGTVHAWAPLDIMTNILDPNKSIAHGYDMWIVKLNNGKSIQGIISTETPTAITLSNTEGAVTNIPRQDISFLAALGI